ncbi:MAG TPA: VOC family protein [Thermoplasmata archaeon]|nr:VOC family protein [Thermoplasmata archaeon]
MRLRHFGIRVADLDKSISFYTRFLGLRIVGGGKMRRHGRWALLEDPRTHQRLKLIWIPSDVPVEPPFSGQERQAHVGFSDSHPSTTFRRLVERGAHHVAGESSEETHEPKRSFFLRDPDGIWIELF